MLDAAFGLFYSAAFDAEYYIDGQLFAYVYCLFPVNDTVAAGAADGRSGDFASLGVGLLYYIGVGLTAVLIAYEHRLVSPDDLSKVNVAFFTTQGVISMVLFVLVATDTIL